jgi:hypothetical protein
MDALDFLVADLVCDDGDGHQTGRAESVDNLERGSVGLTQWSVHFELSRKMLTEASSNCSGARCSGHKDVLASHATTLPLVA